MNNVMASCVGVAMSGAALFGMVDPASVEDWVRSGAFGVGTALLVWQLLKAYKRQDESYKRQVELQKQAADALQKCANCPLALAANEDFIKHSKED